MKKYKEYVLGFAFSKDAKTIVLINKQKPDWQKGKFNGIGGKVEKSDINSLSAMIREFREETGVDTGPDKWHEFGCMTFENDITGEPCKIYLFKMFNNCVHDCSTKESEEIVKLNTYTILDAFSCTDKFSVFIHNLPILIPLALSNEFRYTNLCD